MKRINAVFGLVSLIVISTIILKLLGLYNVSWWIVFLPLLLPLAVYYIAIVSGMIAGVINKIKLYIKGKRDEREG